MPPLTHPDSVMVPDVSDPGICGKIGADVWASACPAATMNMKTVSDVFMADLLEPVQLRPEVKAGLSQHLLKSVVTSRLPVWPHCIHSTFQTGFVKLRLPPRRQ